MTFYRAGPGAHDFGGVPNAATRGDVGGGGGLLFGLAVRPDGAAVYFVDDGTNSLALLH